MLEHEDDLPDERFRPDELRTLIRQALDFAESGRGHIAIVAIRIGLGKTREALRQLATWGKGTILAHSHDALDERAEEAVHLGLDEVRHLRSVLSVRDDAGNHVCLHVTKIRPWARHINVRQSVCAACPSRGNYRGTGTRCPAFGNQPGSGPTFATYGHASVLGPKGELPGDRYVDELPPLVQTEKMSLDELRVLWRPDASHDVSSWCAPRRPLAKIILEAASALRRRDDPGQRSWYTARKVALALRDLLIEAAGEEALLTAAIDEFKAGHALRPEPPRPSGAEMIAGVSTIERPRIDLDAILAAIAKEGTSEFETGETACLAIGSGTIEENEPEDGERVHEPIKVEVWIEHRRRAFDEWTDETGARQSGVILDGTAQFMKGPIRSTLPKNRVKFFSLDALEISGAVERVPIQTSSLTRRALFGRRSLTPRLEPDADAALEYVLGVLAARCEPKAKVGIVTHMPLARLLRECLGVLGKGPDEQERFAKKRRCPRTLEAVRWLHERADLVGDRILWFFGQRGSNALATCRVVAVLGDPLPDIGAAQEEARTLGIAGQGYVRALRDAELAQAFGRAREIRRALGNPVTLIHFGRERSAGWESVLTVEVPHRAGGPAPSRAAILAEQVAREMIDTWGVASPELAKLCVLVPAVAAALSSAHRLRLGPNDTYRTIRAEDLSEIVRLPHRRLQNAFARSAESVGAFMRANPTGHRGRWKLYARSETDADRAIEIIIEALATAGRS